MVVGYGLAASGLLAQTPPGDGGMESEPVGPKTLPTMLVFGESPIVYQNPTSSAALFADLPLLKVPFSVGVYNERLIEDQRAFTLPEVLDNDPSVARQMPSGFYNNQNLGLRGFRVDNFVGYRADGLPITHVVAPYVDDKARVEVLKGPAGLRYGFMPPGGAINLARKHPTPGFATSLHFDVDTFGSFYSQLDTAGTVAGGELGYRLVLAGDDFDSFYRNAGGDRFMGSLFTEWKPVEAVRVWGAVSGQDRERNGYYGPLISANGVVLDPGVRVNTMQDWSRNTQETLDGVLGVDIAFSEEWKLRTSLNYQDMGRNAGVSFASAVQDNGDFEDYAFLLGDLQEWETWANHTHLEGGFDTWVLRHDVVLGSDYRELRTRFGERAMPLLGPSNIHNLVRYPRPAEPTASWDSYEYTETGIFLTDTVKVTERFSALLGIRYGMIDVADYWQGALDYEYEASTWAPTAALMYEVFKGVQTYATYTEGMQDGGLTPFRGVSNPYEPLGVQDSQQWEVGAKAELYDGRLWAEVALFQIEQDLAVTDPATRVHSLSGLQRHRGIEFAVRGRVTESLQAGFSAMLLDAEQVDTGDAGTDGKRPQYVPAYQFNLWSLLEIPQVRGLALSVNARFVDRQFLDQGEQFATDAYAVLDLGARYRFRAADVDWTVRANVRNVLDERYYESGEFYPGDAGYLAYGAPVAATLSLQADF